MYFVKVKGINKGSIRMFTLSTCIWCKKTKQFLSELGVEYDYTDLDLLEGAEKERVMNDLKRWNERCSFPTLVINNERCIVGFKEDEIREALGL